MHGQVQYRAALRLGQAGGDGDDLTAQGRPAGYGVTVACQAAGGTKQVMGDRRAEGPRPVRGEPPGGLVGHRAVDEVGEHGLDDGVAAVGDVSVGSRLDAVGEQRVVAPLCAGPRYVWVRGVRERLPVGCGAGAFDCFT